MVNLVQDFKEEKIQLAQDISLHAWVRLQEQYFQKLMIQFLNT